MKKIAVTGKSGLLSIELQKLYTDLIVLDSIRYNITYNNIIKKLKVLDPDIIIHAAAVTDSNIVKQDPVNAINTNIIGTANICNYCIQCHKRLIYISTDYVYDGINGNYKETDPVLPQNEYAWTKLGGECSVKLVPNSLIIRTSFGASKFPYSGAWVNQLVSKDYVDIIAPMILKASLSSETGILNIGTCPKSLYEYASKRNNIQPIYNIDNRNFTLNTQKYEYLFSNQ